MRYKKPHIIGAYRSNDWCHVCGKRSDVNIEIRWPENAEHNDRFLPENYLRICSSCIDKAQDACHKVGSTDGESRRLSFNDGTTLDVNYKDGLWRIEVVQTSPTGDVR